MIALRFAATCRSRDRRPGRDPRRHRQVPAPPRAAAAADRARARGGGAAMTDDVLETRLREHFAGRAAEASTAAGPPGWRPDGSGRPERPCSAGGGRGRDGRGGGVGVLVVRAPVDRSLGPVIVGAASPPAASPTLMPGDGVTTPSVALSSVRRSSSSRSSWRPRGSEASPSTLGGVDRRGRVTIASAPLGGPRRGRRSWTRGAGRPASVGSSSTARRAHARGGVHAGSERVFSFALPVTNDGSLPVTIHGLAIRGGRLGDRAARRARLARARADVDRGVAARTGWRGAVATGDPVARGGRGPQRPRRGRAMRRGARRRGVGARPGSRRSRSSWTSRGSAMSRTSRSPGRGGIDRVLPSP